MVQWLRLPMQGALVGDLEIPGWGTRNHMLQLKVYMPQQKIPYAATKAEDPACCN